MERHVVTSFLKKEDFILLLRRSMQVSFYRGKWAAISGSVESDETVLDTALREIKEETGISPSEVRILGMGNVFKIPYTEFDWIVHPILFNSLTFDVELNWENDEASWLRRAEMEELDTVPGLLDALDNLLRLFGLNVH
jgi:8-oxo-dGTP pyrophosphatase MutT (NUDIX family)